MKQFLAFVRNEFYHISRDKRTILILLGMPIVQIIIFGFAITTEVKNVRVAVFDPSKDEVTQKIIDKIDANEYMNVITRIDNPQDIQTTFKEGKADIVAMGRAHIADPELVNKTLRGETDNIRPCLRCNVCGEKPRDFFPVRCAVNPSAGRETEYRYTPRPEKKKRVVVIGGGPAGMEAAITASSRGHKVVLYEERDELGGALRMAASPAFKSDMKRFMEWMIRKTINSGAQIRLGIRAGKDAIKDDKPDVLIVAIGAEPLIPDIPGAKGPNVVWAGDVDTGQAATGETILVAGAGLTGCETALMLSRQGKKVTIVDILPETDIVKDATMVVRTALLGMLHENNVQLVNEVRLDAITRKGARVTDRAGNSAEMHADTIILSLGVRPLRERVEEFRGLAKELHIIGDCARPRNLMSAIHEAFNITAEM